MMIDIPLKEIKADASIIVSLQICSDKLLQPLVTSTIPYNVSLKYGRFIPSLLNTLEKKYVIKLNMFKTSRSSLTK